MKSRGKYGLLFVLLLLSIGGCSTKEAAPKEDKAAPKEEQAVMEQTEEKELAEMQNPTYIAEGIRKISIVKDKEERLRLSYEPKEYESSHEYWNIDIPYGPFAIVDTEAALQLFHKMEALEYQVVSEGMESADTGLDQTQTSIRLEFCQTKPEERQASLQETAYNKSESPSYKANADSTCTLLIGNPNGQGAYYTALDSDVNQVFLMPKEEIDAILNTEPFGLILKVSASPSIDTVKQITIEADGQTCQMNMEQDRYYINEKEVDETAYHEKYTDIFSIFVTDEAKEPEKKGEELLSITLERTTKEAENIEITYYAYDETSALVNVNGVEKLLVSKEDVESKKKAFLKK